MEQSKGYANSAVIGGLDNYLQSWSAQSSKNNTPLVSRIRYADMGMEDRRQWIEVTLKQIGNSNTKLDRSSKKRTSSRAPAAKTSATPLNLDSSITFIKGIQSNVASKFGKLGVFTIRDLIYFFPHRHSDFRDTVPISDVLPGTDQTVSGIIWEASARQIGRRGKSTEAIIGDDTGNIRAVWFNNPYLAQTLIPNRRVALSGRVGLFRGQKVFESPDYEVLSEDDQIHTGRLVPVYPLTEGLHQRSVRKLVKKTLDIWVESLHDFLPSYIREQNSLLDLPIAINQAHYPDDDSTRDQARRRLAFDELLLMQLRVLRRRREWQEGQEAYPLKRDEELLGNFEGFLPFILTSAQKRALEQILTDLEGSRPMSRLLQGEVGSGKTVVATGALLVAVAHGHQAAIMAPTEILAEQHFKTICRLLGGEGNTSWGNQVIQVFDVPFRKGAARPVRVGLLISDIRGKAKRTVQEQISQGGVDIAVGTHALIQKDVEFQDLAVAVVDEQHRFGVLQRSALRQKGVSPHLLVMTATPIPRTLALTFYGDLDVSVLDELPPGRQEIVTKWVPPQSRGLAYDFVRKQACKGRQAFVICPLIEESEVVQARAATQEYNRLCTEVFPDLRLGLLHGRLSALDKDQVMEQFRNNEMDILVSTPVVEVGIDIPNATVMMVEGADRFGLSQLHQFRGRVGRGTDKSYCMLLSDYPSQEAMERLSLMEKTSDGFVLAEEDLRLRGPGEFFGTRQSGLPDLRMARLSDTSLLELARRVAEKLFDVDPELTEPEHRALSEELARFGPAWDIGGAEA